MRSIRFLPLVFLVGIDGFVMFAPYALAVMVAAYTFDRSRPEPALVPVRS